MKCLIDLQKKTISTDKDVDVCADHRYKIRLITRNPTIIYIENFLTANEIEHLIELA